MIIFNLKRTAYLEGLESDLGPDYLKSDWIEYCSDGRNNWIPEILNSDLMKERTSSGKTVVHFPGGEGFIKGNEIMIRSNRESSMNGDSPKENYCYNKKYKFIFMMPRDIEGPEQILMAVSRLLDEKCLEFNGPVDQLLKAYGHENI